MDLLEDMAGLVAGAATLGIALDERQQAAFAAYAALLVEWNERFNLLGPSAVRSLYTRHLLDALTLVLALPGGPEAGNAPRLLIDVGSGAGLPGVPLAILFPRWQVTVLEVTTKKVRFLELATRELGLTNTLVVAGRAEDLAHDPQYRQGYDLCVARAVADAASLVELTLPFIVRGGSAIFYKGLTGLSEEVARAEPARVLAGAGPPAVIPVAIAADDARCLVRYVKVSRTPSALPRAAGLPEHRPLTAADTARIRQLEVARQERRGNRRPNR